MTASLILFTFLTWIKGSGIVIKQRISQKNISLKDFISSLETFPPQIINGSAIFLNSDANTVPSALLHNLKHNKVLHEKVAFLTIHTRDEPYVDKNERLSIEKLSEHFYRINAYYGFQEIPSIQEILLSAQMQNLSFDLMDCSFFLSHENILLFAQKM